MQQDQNASSDSLQKLQDLLQKLFRADAADLDFGIYRIINQRRKLIEDFIDEELPAEINDALEANAEIESDLERLEDSRKDVVAAFGDEVLDVDGNLIDESIKDRPGVKKYLEEKERIGSPQTRDQRADVVFNHLYTFFSRYYVTVTLSHVDVIHKPNVTLSPITVKRYISTGQTEINIMSRAVKIFQTTDLNLILNKTLPSSLICKM